VIKTLRVRTLIYRGRESDVEPEATWRTCPVSQKKLKVKGVLFDLDGTIVDSRAAYFEAAKVAFTTLCKEPLEARAALEIPKRLEQGLPIDDLIGANVKAFLGVYLRTYYSITKTLTKPVANVKATLEALSREAKLALITMRFVPNASVIEELQEFGLAKFFTYVVTAMDTHKPKPSPESLISAVEALDVDMCDCVIVGDSVVDVRAGKSAGAMTVAVLSGLYSREELSREKPDLVVQNVSELPVFLEFAF
jgi:HAD superfamily hydrolase (TIGR01509 family)